MARELFAKGRQDERRPRDECNPSKLADLEKPQMIPR